MNTNISIFGETIVGIHCKFLNCVSLRCYAHFHGIANDKFFGLQVIGGETFSDFRSRQNHVAD
jgi:hypothetical protein